MRGVGEDELRAHAPLAVDRLGERVLVRVPGLEPRLLAGRQAEHVGVGGARQLGEAEPPVRRAAHRHRAPAQLQIGDRGLQPMRGDAQQLGPHARGRAHHRAHVGDRELVRVVAGEIEPRRRRRVEAAGHRDRVRGEPELVGHDLREHRLVALAARRIAQRHAHLAVGLHAHHRRLRRARRRAPAGDDLVGGEVGARRLHRGGDADAEQPALVARGGLLGPPAPRVVEPLERAPQRRRVVAAVVLGAGRRGVGHLVGGHVVAQPQLGRVQVEAPGQQRHRALDREAHERLADAAVGPARALVGEHRPGLVAHRGDPVAVGDVAELDEVVLGRGDEVLALVRDVADREGQHGAVGPVGQLHVHDPVAGVHERGEVLDPVLDPLHGPAGLPGEQRADQQVGRAALVAEAAADVRAREAHPRLRHAERSGQHRDRQARPLVVGPELEDVGARVVLRDAAEGLERGGGVALDREALAQHAVRARHRLVHRAVGERVVPDHVGAELRVEERTRRARWRPRDPPPRAAARTPPGCARARPRRWRDRPRPPRPPARPRSARGPPPGSSRAPPRWWG